MHKINPRSIRFRLTAWYAAILMVTFACAAVLVWVALAHSITATVDRELASRLATVRGYVEEEAKGAGAAHMTEELSEDAVVNEGSSYLRIADPRGALLYDSPNTKRWPNHIPGGDQLPARGIFLQISIDGKPFRVLSAPVSIGTVQIGSPLNEFREMQNAFLWIALLGAPLVLLAATLAGYWISGRALRPVDQIADAAQRITSLNLSERLPCSGIGDELDKLSKVLNDMLTRLESAFRRIEQFTADASHELRTPLAIIRTTAELTLSRTRSLEEHQRAWKSVLAQTERTTELVNDLLTLTRADSGAEIFEPHLTDIAELVSATVSEMEVLAGSKGVRFHFSATSHPFAAADETSLRRLFTILLENALKATPRGGLVDVSVALSHEDEPHNCVVTVQDTGVGISPEDLPHIFDRFYRASKDRSRESGGAGLGLAIAHWIASRHRGAIQVESAVGHGATFRVVLPLAAEPQASFSNSSESSMTL